jgi:phosphatidylserine/phosphatidylglycerophosphate/cardiolipin synthase-like enzyme
VPRALSRQLAAGRLPLTWAPARVIADRPSKLDHDDDPAPQETMFDNIDALLRSAKQEVILVSPYFVPGAHGMAILGELRARGVAVRVLTSSLAATDAPVVHIGYARYREDLLRLGVMLHELRPEVGRTQVRLGRFGSSSSKLHAKALVIDKQRVLIGSMNYDPRSDRLNTEVGVLMASPAIAREIAAMYEAICEDAAWRLSLDDDGSLRWTARPGADSRLPAVATREPGASLWLRMALGLLAPLAPDEML